MLGADGLWNLAFSFLILLWAVSSRFESRKNTSELEAGLGIVEDSTTFLKKTAVNRLPWVNAVGRQGCVCMYTRACAHVCVLGEKGGVLDVHEIYLS